MTLKEKLHKIYDTIDKIDKRGYNKAQSYKYIKAADVTNAIRAQLTTLKVYAEINYEFVGPSYTIAREKAPNAPFTAERVKCTIVFHDLESNETLTSSGLGTGADTNDKASYKAQTGSLKYALKNAFLVPDEADPEADESVDERPNYSSNEPPDFHEARHTTPRPATAPKDQERAERPIATPAASQTAHVAAGSNPPAQSTETAQAAAPERGDAYEGPDQDRLPTEEELTVYRSKFSKLGDDLTDAGKLKSSKSLPVNRKLLVFLLAVTNASEAKQISKAAWDNFFQRVDTARAGETGLIGLAKLVNKFNGIEDKK